MGFYDRIYRVIEMVTYKEINEIIKEYDSIVIYRHIHSDYDAYGSSLGLKHLLMDNYPEKKVYCVGYDDIDNPAFLEPMDIVEEETIRRSLAMIVDTSTADRVEMDSYKLAGCRVRIDHHPLTVPVAEYELVDDTASSACQLIMELAIDNNWKISQKAASYLYAGSSTDTLKFTIDKVDGRLFRDLAVLFDTGISLNDINRYVYDLDIHTFNVHTYFRSKIEFEGNAAWLKISDEDMKKAGIDYRSGKDMVDLMSNITGVDKYALFIEGEPGKVSCSLRW